MGRTTPRVLINLEALERLPASGKSRMEVITFAKSLVSTSDTGGDFQVTDPETHREFQVNLIAGYAVTWWIDQPVAEIKVVDIRAII